MAWQTPKTNWLGTDGVRNTDLNRIEGNILDIFSIGPARYAPSIYVAATGNDNTGNGSSGAPYRTIAKALSLIPKDLNGYNPRIILTAGSYPENLEINGYTGGTIIFTASSSIDITITRITVANGSKVTFDGYIRLTVTGVIGLSVISGSLLTCNNDVVLSYGSGGIYGITCGTNAVVMLTANVAITGYSTAIDCNTGGLVHVAVLNGSGATTLMNASMGGTITYIAINASASTRFATSSGGRIYSGAQTSIPNY